MLTRPRSAFVGVLAAAVIGGGIGTADAAALPPQGTYDQCGPALSEPGHGEAECLRRLATLHKGGFRLNLNYTIWYSTPAQLRRYMDRAQQLGIKLIWPLNAPPWRHDTLNLKDHYRYLGRYCVCLTNHLFRLFAIGLVKNHPATWGYYIGDELPRAELPAVKLLRSELRLIDPHHPRLYVALENGLTLGRNLEPFAPLADVAAADSYPVGTDAPISTVGRVMRSVQGVADRNGRRSAAVLQAFDLGRYLPQIAGGWPTRSEMQWMRDLALRESRPAFILWYSMHDIARSDDPARRFEDLRAAAFAPPRAPGEIVLPRQRLPITRGGRLAVMLRCNPAEPDQNCSGSLRVRRVRGRRTLASGRFTLRPGDGAVLLRTRRALRRLLRRKGRVRMVASLREQVPRRQTTRRRLLAVAPGVSIPRQRLRVPRRRAVRVRLRCEVAAAGQPCRGRLQIRRPSGGRALASRRFALDAGKHTLIVRRARGLRRLVRRRRRVRVVVVVSERSTRGRVTRRRLRLRAVRARPGS